jgi:hypothetical protein
MEIGKDLECKNAKRNRLKEEVAYLRASYEAGSMTEDRLRWNIRNVKRKIKLFRKLDLL